MQQILGLLKVLIWGEEQQVPGRFTASRIFSQEFSSSLQFQFQLCTHICQSWGLEGKGTPGFSCTRELRFWD